MKKKVCLANESADAGRTVLRRPETIGEAEQITFTAKGWHKGALIETQSRIPL